MKEKVKNKRFLHPPDLELLFCLFGTVCLPITESNEMQGEYAVREQRELHF